MRTVTVVILAVGIMGCTGGMTAPQDATVRDAVGTVDASTDAGPDCVALCTSAAGMCSFLDAMGCETACATGAVADPTADGGGVGLAADVHGCLLAAGTSCSASRACLRPPPVMDFSPGPYGNTPRSVAGDFTLPTSDGDWNFRSEWTGTDHYLFLVYDPGALMFGSTDYSGSLFQGALEDLLRASPRNVHYFFLWQNDQPGFTAIRDGWLAQFADLTPADQAWWRPRVHFVTTRANQLQGWVGDLVRYRFTANLPYKQFDPVQWAIDRTQHVREVGQLGTLTATGIATDITFLANEPVYYNFERDRDAALALENALVVPLVTEQTAHDTVDMDVTLPDAATMATYDTLEVDHTIACPHHRDGECGAWDYLSYLWICQPAPTPDGGTPDGGSPDAAMDVPDAGTSWQCNTELARWITTYWREGRWVTDISGMLPNLQPGGRVHFRWYASGQFDPRSTDYIATLALRFVHGGRASRPAQRQSLWTGGGLNATYDSMHPPVHFTVPPGVHRVELQTLLTGHGGVAPYNCSEFCDHQHHFTVNGHTHTEDFPGAQSPDGCAQRVDAGVVPNQHGTWYYGRGGWCPGGDVPPWIVDITSDLVPGDNVITYTTTFANRPVTANLGNIVLTSSLVYWQ